MVRPRTTQLQSPRPIPIDFRDSCYWMDCAADVAETTYIPFQSEPDAAPVRLIVLRVNPPPVSS